MRRRLASTIVGLFGVAAICAPASAFAHPLGNFTTNQLVTVKVSSGEATLGYVLDQAEIPTFQEISRYDSNGDEQITGAEATAFEQDLLTEPSANLKLSADGRPVELAAPTDIELSFPPGQGGLPLTRLTANFTAPLPAGASVVQLDNDAFQGRIGWRAIQAVPGDGTDVVSNLPVTDPTDSLRAYPVDLLSSPFDQRQASLDVSAGNGTVSGPDGPAVSSDAETGRLTDGFANLLAGGDTQGALILLVLAAAFGWGALHALSPGHGKAMVAGYLVGSSGKPRHAAALGLTVTATHTVSVFALGLVTLALSQYIVPEQLYPWLGVVSGAMIIGIGLWVMIQRLRRWRALRAGAADPTHGHSHDHGHSHSDGHSHSHDHSHGHSHTHSHDAPISTRELLGLGVSGGMVPCPSALVVLIAAISQHRIGLGLLLIFAFSLGLAATITAIGLVTIWGKRLVRRFRPERMLFGGRITGALPAMSASVIIVAGVLITARAIPTFLMIGSLVGIDFNFLFAPFEQVDSWLTALLQGAPLLVALGVAFLLGLRHASDPDHLVAVTSLIAADGGDTRDAARLGAWWGFGHAAVLILLGIPLILFKSVIPAWLESGAESLIGLVIVVLAARVVLKWIRGDFRADRHAHEPSGEGSKGAHRHLHEATAHAHRHIRTPRQAFAIGTLHGLAGTGAVAVLLLTALPTQLEAALALAVFAPMSVVSMIGCTSLFAWILTRRLIDPIYRTVLIPCLGLFGMIFGAWYAGIG